MQRNFQRLLVLLIMIIMGFSYALSATATPATRTQNLKSEDTSALPSFAKMEHVLDVGNGEKVVVDMEEGFMERRVDLETQDYDGTGANRDHEPKPPRRV